MKLHLFFICLVFEAAKSFVLRPCRASRFSLNILRRPSFVTTSLKDGNIADNMKSAFDRLKQGQDQVYYNSFLNLPGIQKLVSRDVLGDKDIERVWLKVMSDTQKPANFGQFLAINDEISNLFGREENPSTAGSVSDYVWDPEFPVADKFRCDALNHIRKYFHSVATASVHTISTNDDDRTDPDGVTARRNILKKKPEDATEHISFGSFAEWPDVTEMLEEGKLDSNILNQLWLEAVEYRYCKLSLNDERTRKKKALSATMKQDIENKNLLYNTDRALMIDLDTFLRVNYRLDEIVDDILSHPVRQAEKQLERFYRQEFERVTNHEMLMSYDRLLHWKVIQEMLNNKAITENDVKSVWDVLPHQFLQEDGPVRLFAPRGQSDVPGITVDSFIALNDSLQDTLRRAMGKY